MDMATILFSGAEPFEKIVNTLSTDGLVWNLVKVAQLVSEKKLKTNLTILHNLRPPAHLVDLDPDAIYQHSASKLS